MLTARDHLWHHFQRAQSHWFVHAIEQHCARCHRLPADNPFDGQCFIQVLLLKNLTDKLDALEKDSRIASKALQADLNSYKAEVQELKKERDATQDSRVSLPCSSLWHSFNTVT